MVLALLAPGVADALKNADAISSGLESGPIRYVAALSLLTNLGLFLMLMRVQALRVSELKQSAKDAQKLGSVLEQHNNTARILERTMEFVGAQLPKKKIPHGEPEQQQGRVAK